MIVISASVDTVPSLAFRNTSRDLDSCHLVCISDVRFPCDYNGAETSVSLPCSRYTILAVLAPTGLKWTMNPTGNLRPFLQLMHRHKRLGLQAGRRKVRASLSDGH
ncbi:hypothetical protein Ddc_24780 [Ditylenchus destructor]|nr:hypothetical protein Ddc_24780 [Ditylenchus destructor]